MGDNLNKPFYSSIKEQEEACDRIRPYVNALLDIQILERLLENETDPIKIDSLKEHINELELFVDIG